jgi:hypothetical protein
VCGDADQAAGTRALPAVGGDDGGPASQVTLNPPGWLEILGCMQAWLLQCDMDVDFLVTVEKPKAMIEFTNVLWFPCPQRGTPNTRRLELASMGFRWHGSHWRRGRAVLSERTIDQLDNATWARRCRRWARRRPVWRP